MRWQDHTPEQLAQWGNNLNNTTDEIIRIFLREAPSNLIEKYSADLTGQNNKRWIEPARFALQIKLAQETASALAAQMEKLLIHTKTLNEKAVEQIAATTELSAQNVILVRESRSLTKYTKALTLMTVVVAVFTVVIAILTVALVWKEFHL